MCSQSKREILKMGTESFHVDHHHTCRVFKHILKGFSSLLFEPRKQPIDPCVLPRESSPQRFPRSFSLVFLLKPADLGCEKSLFIYFLIRCWDHVSLSEVTHSHTLAQPSLLLLLFLLPTAGDCAFWVTEDLWTCWTLYSHPPEWKKKARESERERLAAWDQNNATRFLFGWNEDTSFPQTQLLHTCFRAADVVRLN